MHRMRCLCGYLSAVFQDERFREVGSREPGEHRLRQSGLRGLPGTGDHHQLKASFQSKKGRRSGLFIQTHSWSMPYWRKNINAILELTTQFLNPAYKDRFPIWTRCRTCLESIGCTQILSKYLKSFFYLLVNRDILLLDI